MPFTFSHPAIVLPLGILPKKWVSLTGLIIGSIIPDFEKFFKMAPHNTFSHTWHGIFWFNLPTALFLCFVFHLVVRDTLIENLPVFLKRRFHRFTSFDWNAYIMKHIWVVIISILIGTASHIFWDSFTHSKGIMVRNIDFLATRVYINHAYTPIYLLFDRVSSVAGLVFVTIIVLRLPKDDIQHERNFLRSPYWYLFGFIVGLVLILRLVTELSIHDTLEIIISVISAIFMSLILTPLLIKIIEK